MRHPFPDSLEPGFSCFCVGQTVSFSSPEFLKLLPEMDEKMVPIEHVKVSEENNPRLMDSKNQGVMFSDAQGLRDYDKP